MRRRCRPNDNVAAVRELVLLLQNLLLPPPLLLLLLHRQLEKFLAPRDAKKSPTRVTSGPFTVAGTLSASAN